MPCQARDIPKLIPDTCGQKSSSQYHLELTMSLKGVGYLEEFFNLKKKM